jgi:hypothetical protein
MYSCRTDARTSRHDLVLGRLLADIIGQQPGSRTRQPRQARRSRMNVPRITSGCSAGAGARALTHVDDGRQPDRLLWCCPQHPKPLSMMRVDDILRNQPYSIATVCVRASRLPQICVACTKITLHTCWCTCACASVHKAALAIVHACISASLTDFYTLQLSGLILRTQHRCIR